MFFSQNHDQVGNHPFGDRPDDPELRAALLLFTPQIPLLFMGEEYGERSPFPFFCDHGPAIAESVRSGRRAEIRRLTGFSGEIPDPQDRGTFERAKLTRRENARVKGVYEQLLRLRRELPPEIQAHVDGDVLRVRRGTAELTVDFDRRAWELRV